MVKALTVYKASAGSGKTFTLAVEYIRLLVENPTNYRAILAVTFTNKATEEMKMRILSQLYGISLGLGESEPYLRQVMAATELSTAQVRERAGEALHLLLHNFSYFRVETIDTFFQSILRNLARELDLTANLRIGLNDVQVEEEAVDQLIDSLTRSDRMLQWIMRYIMDTISDDRSWNIIGQVKQFGRTIFRDYYKEHSAKLNQRLHEEGFTERYMSQMRQIRQAAADRMTQLADDFFDTLESDGLSTDDLTYGRAGVAGFFLKLKGGQMDEGIIGKRVTDCMDDAAKWYTKKHPRAEFIHALADSQLIPLLRRAVEERQQQWKLYQSAELTLRHLSQLRLLSSIEQKVRQLNEEANRFLLSDTQQLLHALINDSDSPFIFEKIGTRLEHIMIDEFQDTSTVQWKNFKVLLHECMSHQTSHNLIVGDVKQSIYRWRSGDWRLLNAIETELPHADEMMEVRPLDTNYRSARHIVTFNNAFFTEASRRAYEEQREEFPDGAEQLRLAYADVEQQVPAQREPRGLVSIQLLPAADYQEAVLQGVADTIEMLLQQGATEQSMAILVRSNHLIPLIADFLAQRLPQIHIVSDEAFRLDASAAVNLLIQALRLLTHPDDKLAHAVLAKRYQRAVLGADVADNELLLRDRPLDDLLPDAYTAHTDELRKLPLYELTERLFTIFQLQRLQGEYAYICTFFDQLNQFVQENATDIDAFLNEWEETLCSKTVQGNDISGIRILSIHKSKGLEFDNVIIPFCDWRLEHPDILWCEPGEAPFNALPIVPVDYSGKQMRGTIYEHGYLDEHLQNTVDNLNLLYVAFTRAAHNLFVMGRRDARNTRSGLIQDVLTNLSLDGGLLEGNEDVQAPMAYTYGSLHIGQKQQRGTTENVFLKPVTPLPVAIDSFEVKTEFRQSNKSRDFIEGDDGEPATTNYIRIGSVLHQIFSTIRTTADIGSALRQMQESGVLYDDDITSEKLTTLIRKRLEDRRVSSWFSDGWTLFNECSILNLDPEGNVVERRPDRVMTNGTETHVVDFKFGQPRPEHKAQVEQYMRLLTDMGLPQVKGWLWYVYSNKIVEV